MPRIEHLDTIAQEEGTYPVKFSFKDKLRQLIEIASVTAVNWWLSDLTGTILNARSNVSVSELTNPLYIVLSGDDLQILDKLNGYEERIVTLKGLYNSDHGNALPFTYAVGFTLLNNLIVSSHLFVEVADVIFTGDVVNV